MLQRLLLRQQTPLRAVCAPCRRVLLHKEQRRRRHAMPTLAHGESFAQKGVSGLLSPEGFKIAWTDYQNWVIQQLNLNTIGTEFETWQVLDIVKKTARDPQNAARFNFASMAHNNAFFFRTLLSEAPTPPEPMPQTNSTGLEPYTGIPETLEKELVESFGSISTLRETFLATARGMFGPGFVWLVMHPSPNDPNVRNNGMSILTTYNAGSPYPQAHYRSQSTDMATANTGVVGGTTEQQFQQQYANRYYGGPLNRIGAFGRHSGTKTLAPGGMDSNPILCVSTWEHSYIRDWGCYGKYEYLEAWWNSIDWNQVLWNSGIKQEAKPRTRMYDHLMNTMETGSNAGGKWGVDVSSQTQDFQRRDVDPQETQSG